MSSRQKLRRAVVSVIIWAGMVTGFVVALWVGRIVHTHFYGSSAVVVL